MAHKLSISWIKSDPFDWFWVLAFCIMFGCLFLKQSCHLKVILGEAQIWASTVVTIVFVQVVTYVHP